MNPDYDPDFEERGPARDPIADRPGRRPSNRSLWLILGGVGCVAVLGCGGLVTFVAIWGVRTFTTDLPAATAAAKEFLDLIREGRVADAYESTSAGFRARQTPGQFAAFVKQFETLTRHSSRTVNGTRLFQNPGGKQAFVQMTLHAPNNAMTCTLVMVENDTVWKVDQITVP